MELSQKRVLVTGADGFIGSHLVERLVPVCGRVRALAQYNSFNHWGWLEGLPCLNELEVVTGDIRDAHLARELLDAIDVVFHLAALIPIPYSYRAPDSFVDTNVKGTLNLCQAARAHGIERFVQTSTSEVYGTDLQRAIGGAERNRGNRSLSRRPVRRLRVDHHRERQHRRHRRSVRRAAFVAAACARRT